MPSTGHAGIWFDGRIFKIGTSQHQGSTRMFKTWANP